MIRVKQRNAAGWFVFFNNVNHGETENEKPK